MGTCTGPRSYSWRIHAVTCEGLIENARVSVKAISSSRSRRTSPSGTIAPSLLSVPVIRYTPATSSRTISSAHSRGCASHSRDVRTASCGRVPGYSLSARRQRPVPQMTGSRSRASTPPMWKGEGTSVPTPLQFHAYAGRAPASRSRMVRSESGRDGTCLVPMRAAFGTPHSPFCFCSCLSRCISSAPACLEPARSTT